MPTADKMADFKWKFFIIMFKGGVVQVETKFKGANIHKLMDLYI